MPDPDQLTLGLPHQPSLGRADFLIGESNRLALAVIDAWPDWPNGAVLLCGPPGSGKSHLVAVWMRTSGAEAIFGHELAGFDAEAFPAGGALAIEDIDAPGTDPTVLFHLLNLAGERRGSVLMTARDRLVATSVTLPDLASRLRAAQPADLLPPDDALLARVLVKLFADRQLVVGPEVVSYVVRRMERSFDAARIAVERLDGVALAGRRPVSRSLAADVMRELSGASDDDI